MRHFVLVSLLVSCGHASEIEERVTRYANGRPWAIVSLHRGRLHGPARTWYGDGTEKSRGTYTLGRRTGTWETWHPNGEPLTRGEYADGRQRGLWEHWFADGKPASRGRYGDGKLVGLWESWYGNGNLRSTVTFDEDGLQHGVSTEYWPGGGPRTETRFEHGESVRERYHHENGRLFGQGPLRGGQRVGRWRFWNVDGAFNERLSGVYADDGRIVEDLGEELAPGEEPFEL